MIRLVGEGEGPSGDSRPRVPVRVRALSIGGSTAYDLARAAEFDAAVVRVAARVKRGDVIVVSNKAQRDKASIELSRVGKLPLAQIAAAGDPATGAAVRVTAGRYAGRVAAVAGHVGRAVTYLLVPGHGLVNANYEQFEGDSRAEAELRAMGLGAVVEIDLE